MFSALFSGSLLYTAGTVLGIVLAVLGPAAGIGTWLAITYTYRLSKRSIVLGVAKHIKTDDIADAAGSAAPLGSSGSVQMTQVNGTDMTRQPSGRLSSSKAFPV